jgi:hypothetical protein
MLVLTLPLWVTAIGAVQAVWWLAAAITLIVRRPFPAVVSIH